MSPMTCSRGLPKALDFNGCNSFHSAAKTVAKLSHTAGRRSKFKFALQPTCSGTVPSNPASNNLSSNPADDDVSFTGSRAWRSRPPAVALPAVLSGPGRWFLLAGLLKVLLLSLHSPISFAVMGVALPGGLATVLVVLPFALALGYVSRVVLERGWLRLRWTVPLIVLTSVALLVASSALFGSPRAPALSPAQLAERQQAAAREVAKKNSLARRTAADANRMLQKFDERMAKQERSAAQ